jgi:aromatic ring-cleaving dioxygenase
MTENTIEIKNFHAHVYYDTDTRSAAACVREQLGALFDVQLGRWRDEPVGPHPKPMYQVAFLPNQLGAALLERRRMSQTTIGSGGGVVEQRAWKTRFIKGIFLYRGR